MDFNSGVDTDWIQPPCHGLMIQRGRHWADVMFSDPCSPEKAQQHLGWLQIRNKNCAPFVGPPAGAIDFHLSSMTVLLNFIISTLRAFPYMLRY